jgi:hypothetical protein
MKAGLDTDHATLGAAISTEEADGDLTRMVVSQMLEESDVYRRGIKQGDQLTAFAGRPMTSTNQYKNVLGIYPSEWRLPIKVRPTGGNKQKETLVRLMGNLDKVVEQPGGPQPGGPGPRPQPQPQPQPGPPPAAGKATSPANKLYQAKKGFANFYFNIVETKALVERFQKTQGDFTSLTGPWKLEGKIALSDRDGDIILTWQEDNDNATEVKLVRGQVEDSVKPLAVKGESAKAELMLPLGSGGMLVALDQYRRLLTQLEKGFNANSSTFPGFIHGGMEPWYPLPLDGKLPESYSSVRVDCDVLRTKQAQFESKWYFSQKDGLLIGGEVTLFKEEDPCELYFHDYKDVGDGRKLPHTIEVRWGDKRYALITARTFTLTKK